MTNTLQLDACIRQVPALAPLVEAGHIRVIDTTIEGRAADGEWVSLTTLGFGPRKDLQALKSLAAYLSEHPTPATW